MKNCETQNHIKFSQKIPDNVTANMNSCSNPISRLLLLNSAKIKKEAIIDFSF